LQLRHGLACPDHDVERWWIQFNPIFYYVIKLVVNRNNNRNPDSSFAGRAKIRFSPLPLVRAQIVMAPPDGAIALSLVLMRMARSGRATGQRLVAVEIILGVMRTRKHQKSRPRMWD